MLDGLHHRRLRLDNNKTDAIRPWRRTGYSFIKRAGQDGPAWVSLEGKDGAAQVATAEP